MSNLSKAIYLATKGHLHQLDKGGKPYILHSLRIMMAGGTDDEEFASILIMHDLIEDTDMTLNDLRDHGFSERVVSGVDGMTKRNGESYDQFIERAYLNSDSREGKKLDIIDNSQMTRLKGLSKKDFDRTIKYQRAFTYLNDK